MEEKTGRRANNESSTDAQPSPVSSLTGRKEDSTQRSPPQPPDLEGYLDKLKHKTTLFVPSWNRRYFVVHPDSKWLAYYNNKEEYSRGDKATGRIDLFEIRAVRKFDDTSFQVDAPGRTFHLRAESKAGMACWLLALQQFVTERQNYDRWKAVYEASRQAKS